MSYIIGESSVDVRLAPSGSAVTGIDSLLTQQGQQYVTLSLPAR